MAQPHLSHRRSVAALAAVALTAVGLGTAGSAAAAPNHSTVVSQVPSTLSPDILDGTVFAIHDAGAKVIAGGTFTQVRDRGSSTVQTRDYVLSIDKATGRVDSAFVPQLDGRVNAIAAGPVAGTVYLAGQFNTVNGTTRRKVALLNVSNGSLVTTFQPPALNGVANDIARVGSRLLVGGIFTTAGTSDRGGLASLDATTGTLDSYLTATLTEHHNYDGVSGASAGIGAEKLAVSPDGTKLVVIGNFRKVDGVLHDQVARFDLGTSAATVANWNTHRYEPRCAWRAFDTYMRDVAFSPDGTYFVIVTTGAANAGTLCDAAARWDTALTGDAAEPRWVDYSGGDTFLSVGISEKAVYVGGHLRWLNNSSGVDAAQAGAVGRASIAALDPLSGLPLAWNPGRHPRGYGVAEMLVTADGIWLGSDQPWIGNTQYRRERIAFFPVGGGTAPHSTSVPTLPGRVYQMGLLAPRFGSVGPGRKITPSGAQLPWILKWGRPNPTAGNGMTVRGYDGGTTVGRASGVTSPTDVDWSTTRGAFWVGGTLFYGRNGSLHRRTFNGSSFGAASVVDPYHHPLWDTVPTDSGPAGQTYAGVTTSYYAELGTVTGAFYTNGRLYYTLANQSGLFWRWFSPDSGVVGADRFTVAEATGFADSAGMFLSGSTLYVVSRSTGNLSGTNWVAGAPSGTPSVRSGPSRDGVDWRAAGIFVGP